MKKRGGGNIINIASIAGLRTAWIAAAHYTTAKAGILGLPHHLAWELGHFKINVNAICPGNVRTAMLEKVSTPGMLMLGRKKRRWEKEARER